VSIEFDRLSPWPDQPGLTRGKYLTPDKAGSKPALDALEADTDLVEAFGPVFVDGYITVKRAEWDPYKVWTTEWETAEYLPFL
jgi:glutamine synthetase